MFYISFSIYIKGVGKPGGKEVYESLEARETHIYAIERERLRARGPLRGPGPLRGIINLTEPEWESPSP